MTVNFGIELRVAEDGCLGVFASKAIVSGGLVECCYCLGLAPSAIPGKQLQPWLFDRKTGADDEVMFFPFGWGILYNEVPSGGGEPNLVWDHEVSMDANGQHRHYINLRAAINVSVGDELCVSRRLDRKPCLRDILGSAIKLLTADPDIEMLEASKFAAFSSVDARVSNADEAILGSTNLADIEMRCSPLHGNGVFARKAFSKGDVVEIAPVLLVQRWEIGECLIDYRFLASGIKPQRSIAKIALGLGSVFNHHKEPNLGYRTTEPDSRHDALSYFQCYFASRDIAEGEELFISYGEGWWQSRAKDQISLADWRRKHGETDEGRPFYDQPSFEQFCEAGGFQPGQVETMHRAFVSAVGGETLEGDASNEACVQTMEAWSKLCEVLRETAQLQGCLDAPLRETGERAMHRAAAMGQVAHLKWLVEHDADVNASTAPSLDLSADGDVSSSLCPAHFAAMYGHRDALTVLQSSGADLNCKRPDGATPLDFAEDTGQSEAAAWLLRRGCVSGLA